MHVRGGTQAAGGQQVAGAEVLVSNVVDVTVQVSRSAAGNWSVTTTLVAGPAPVLVTVMVNEAVSPGWIRRRRR